MAIFTVMEIDEFEAGMLDAVLEAFGDADTLDRELILELFGGDEPLATAVVDLLIATGMATPLGVLNDEGLPATIKRNTEATAFLENGGFISQVHLNKVNAAKEALPPQPPAIDEIPEQVFEPVIQTETEFNADFPANKLEAEPESLEQPQPVKQREIIFEIEIAKGDDIIEEQPSTQSSFSNTNADEHPLVDDEPEANEDALTETNLNTAEQETDEAENFSEELTQLETDGLPIDDHEPELEDIDDEPLAPPTPAILDTEPIEPQSEIEVTEIAANLMAFETETQQLRDELFKYQRDKILVENQLREKDQQIQILETRNAQLAQMRNFIWLLLAVIIFFVIWIVTH